MKKIYLLLSFMLFVCHNAQTYYSQDFNTSGLNGWTATDLNNDTYNWANLNASSIDPALGSGSLVSFSYIDTSPTTGFAITPNNLITSPLINLSAASATNLKLKYNLETHPSWPAEKYSIYVTTSNVPGTIVASTPVYTETVAAGGFSSRTIDLSAFAGQQVYISFRHYDCTDQYYLIIDDIVVKNLFNVDATLSKVSLPYYGVVNSNYSLKATIKNNGVNPISSVTLNWNDGTTDHFSTIPVSNLTINNETTITHTIPVNYGTLTEKNINVTLTQVNSVADSTPADNVLATKFKTVSQNSPKKVLIEEGTGTWCGWCPRGKVAMDFMDTNYPNDFVGIAVHNGDPMVSVDYDNGADISSFPGMNVDRVILGEDVNQALMVSHVQERSNLVVPAALDASGTFASGVLTLNTSTTFRTNFTNANFRLAAIIVEDGVTGTTSGYNQVNYYAGGASGVMGGFQSLPNPVPAAQMVYDHVGRMLLGGYAGAVNSVPTTITDGQVVNYTFTGTIPSTYNMNNLKVVVLLLDATTGEAVNARSFLLSALLGTVEETNANYLTIYPNPASDYIKIQANHNVDLTLYDASGKLVLEKKNILPDQRVSISGLASGMYMATLKERNGKIKNQKIIIK